ncbi:MAG: NAD(+) diphosphatase [Spirochaetaceae bacterium]|nr:NAD(+) diphosphatase [Spirochaetaceae bacterium]
MFSSIDYRYIDSHYPENSLFLCFSDMKTLWVEEEKSTDNPFLQNSAHLQEKAFHIGYYNERPVLAQRVLSVDNTKEANIRDYLHLKDSTIVGLLVRASQLLTWQENHQYCGRCGKETIAMTTEPAMVCQGCNHHIYPVLSPAIMVRIRRDNHILLARNARAFCNTFALIAGFVEAGESLEDALHREVMEEVGLKVHNVRYFSSQSWPLPHTLLMGFTADYLSGDIKPDGEEIVEARWTDPRREESIPRPGSLSRILIDDFIEELNDKEMV